MSVIKKEINQLLKIAKKSPEESEFQKKPQYMNFKKNENIPRKEIERFISGLEKLQHEPMFCEEMIYWYKILLERHIHKKEEKYDIYFCLIKLVLKIYYDSNSMEQKEKDEMLLEYGQKTLDVDFQFENHRIDRKVSILQEITLPYTIFIHHMRKAANNLGKHREAMKYGKEEIKSYAKAYNNGRLTQFEVLESYANFLDFQIENNRFEHALKAFRYINLFNLNSMDPKDVLVALKTEDYTSFFPKSNLSMEENETVLLDYSSVELYQRYNQKSANIEQKQYLNDTMWMESRKNIEKMNSITSICVSKCKVFKGLNDIQHCRMWSRLPAMICNDVLLESINMKHCIPESQQSIWDTHIKTNLVRSIYTLVSLSVCDPGKRKEFFEQLVIQMEPQPESAVSYITEALFSAFVYAEDMMPFLQYFCKHCTRKIQANPDVVLIKYINGIPTKCSYEDERKKMVILKNSLQIQSYFQDHLNKLCVNF